MTDISPYNSHKIGILYVILIYFVLIIHSALLGLEQMPISRALVDFFGNFGLSVASVPLFYAISGLLFFKGGVKSATDCFPKVKKRVGTLLVPFVLWNLLYALCFVVLSMIPCLAGYLSSDVVTTLKGNNIVQNMHYLFIEPVGFHLWFLRDLILYVILSPLIFLCIRKYPWITLLAVYAIFGWRTNIGLTYFILGAIIALHYELDDLKRFHTGQILMVCSLLYVLNAVLCCIHIPSIVMFVNVEYVRQLISLAGIVAFWGLYDIMYKHLSNSVLNKILTAIIPYTFFIYLFHEPALNIVKKIGLLVLGRDDIGTALVYLLAPILMMMVSYIVGRFLKSLMPRVYGILVGGR